MDVCMYAWIGYTSLFISYHTCQSSQETDLMFCCPRSIQNCPGNYLRGKRITKYKFDRDRMLVGQDQCQPQDGCQWVRSAEPLPEEWANQWQPWWGRNRWVSFTHGKNL